MSGILLVVGKHETASQSIGCGVVSWEIRSAGTSLLNAPSSFPRFHSQKPRTSELLFVVGKLRQLHEALVVVSCHGKFPESRIKLEEWSSKPKCVGVVYTASNVA